MNPFGSFYIEDDLSLLNWLVIVLSDEFGLTQDFEDMLVWSGCLQVLGENEPSSYQRLGS